MEFSLPVLVSIDERQRFEVRPIRVTAEVFRGPSLSRLFDDVALAMMERIPKEDATRMPRYELCPHVELRKVKVEVDREIGSWKGRVSAVVSRFAEDDFWIVNVPRLGTDTFALDHPRNLSPAMSRFIEAAFERTPEADLEFLGCASTEYLEILGFDAELPTVLPSQPRPPTKKKKKKKSEEELAPKKKKLVMPITLRQVASNLTHRALDGRLGRAYLREGLVAEILRRMSRAGAALLLVGNSGSGKSALVHELTRRLAAQATRIEDRTEVWRVDGNRIIAGMRMIGAWQARMREMVGELIARQDLLFVDDLPALVHAGRTRHADSNIADFLTPHLARGEIRMIGECTPERLAAVRDEAPGFFSRFSVLPVPQLTQEETSIALVHAVRDLTEHDDFVVAPDALETIVSLTRRFQANRAYPGKAMALLERTLADRRGGRLDDLGRSQLSREDVVVFYQRQTGLPVYVLWERAARDIGEIEAHFATRIIAQPEAQRAAIDVVALLEQGLEDPSRPLASYLFVGPTGVGKTETAKALAEYLFGSVSRMIRLDMSELSGPDSVRRLFGDRFHPEGELTLAVERQPFSVVLLDEIEKAHPSIFDALLQVLGEGRLTNAAGRTIDFSSTIIVMTSNLGVRDAEKLLGFDSRTTESVEAHYRSTAERFFRPEFFNRIDRIVAFRTLGREAIVPLVRRMMEQMLSRRGLLRNQVVVDVDPQVVDLVIDQGFDPRYGARSIKRMLERRLAVPLAQHLATHYVHDLTVADIYPVGGEIRMNLSWPEKRARARLVMPPLVKSWDELELAFRDLVHRFEVLLDDPRMPAIRARHAYLVDAFNLGSLAQEHHAELTALSAVNDQVADLGREIGAFRIQYLEVDPFEERLLVERSEHTEPWDWKKTKSLVAEEARPIRIDRGPRLPEARERLRLLRHEMARLSFRMHASLRGSEQLLIRLAPVVSTASARWFAHEMTVELGGFFARWGEVEHVNRTGGTWEREHGYTMTLETEQFAIWLSGPGVQEIARRELGYYGASDGSTELVRVEEIEGNGDPIARLVARDLSEREWREARRRTDGQDPRPPLPVHRMFAEGPIEDPETGVALYKTTLGADLHEATLMRLYAELSREQP